jgi:chromosome segregation ATPase
VSIEVKNFKSFSAAANKDRLGHVIGPFTDFTGIIGPNGSGKSNIFDAIAFALNLSLAPGKVRHARDLSHRLKEVTLEHKGNASDQDCEFFVKLNLIKTDLQGKKCEKLSIQRGLKKTEADADGQHSYFNEYVINDNESRPLLYNEYKNILNSVYHLDIQEFAVY